MLGVVPKIRDGGLLVVPLFWETTRSTMKAIQRGVADCGWKAGTAPTCLTVELGQQTSMNLKGLGFRGALCERPRGK